MTHEEIIAMAREARLHLPYWGEDEDPEKDPPRWTMVSPLPPLLARYTALVLEKAALKCESRYMGDNNREDMEAKACAKAIREMKP